MKDHFSSPFILSRLLMVFGISIICVQLVRHPEDWLNWLIRLGVGIVVIIVTLSILYFIRYAKNRNLKN